MAGEGELGLVKSSRRCGCLPGTRSHEHDGVLFLTVRVAGPDPHQEAAARRFASHRSYLRAFALLCCTPDPVPNAAPGPLAEVLVDVRDRVRQQSSVSAMAAEVDLRQVRSSLTNAWGTEALLAQALVLPDSDELARLVNQWAVVQAYYAGYHAAQALIVARGDRRPANHPGTQKQFASVWCDRSIDLAPWSLGADRHGWRNHHGRPIDDSADHQALATHETKWHLACKALRTTREDTFEEAYRRKRIDVKKARRKNWRDEEERRVAARKVPRKQPKWWNTRGKLSAEEAAAVRRGVRTYSVLDYLYRLRIGSNYDDASVFIDGPASAMEARDFTRDLVLVTSATMLVHEMHVTQLVGKPAMKAWVDAWLMTTGDTPGGLRERKAALGT